MKLQITTILQHFIQVKSMEEIHPVRSKQPRTSLPLQQPERLKEPKAGPTSFHSTKKPAIFTPMSLFHQRLQVNQKTSFIPQLTSANAQTLSRTNH